MRIEEFLKILDLLTLESPNDDISKQLNAIIELDCSNYDLESIDPKKFIKFINTLLQCRNLVILNLNNCTLTALSISKFRTVGYFLSKTSNLTLDVSNNNLGDIKESSARDFYKLLWDCKISLKKVIFTNSNLNNEQILILDKFNELFKSHPTPLYAIKKEDKEELELKEFLFFFENLAIINHNSEAQYYLGMVYLEGKFGLMVDSNKAQHFLVRAKMQGHPHAAAPLGIIWQKQEELTKRLSTANTAEQQYELGMEWEKLQHQDLMYYGYTKQLLMGASVVGHKDATLYLGLLLLGNKIDNHEDRNRGLQIIEQLAHDDCAHANLGLGQIYWKGSKEIPMQRDRAKACFIRAKQQGSILAGVYLSIMEEEDKVLLVVQQSINTKTKLVANKESKALSANKTNANLNDIASKEKFIFIENPLDKKPILTNEKKLAKVNAEKVKQDLVKPTILPITKVNAEAKVLAKSEVKPKSLPKQKAELTPKMAAIAKVDTEAVVSVKRAAKPKALPKQNSKSKPKNNTKVKVRAKVTQIVEPILLPDPGEQMQVVGQAEARTINVDDNLVTPTYDRTTSQENDVTMLKQSLENNLGQEEINHPNLLLLAKYNNTLQDILANENTEVASALVDWLPALNPVVVKAMLTKIASNNNTVLHSALQYGKQDLAMKLLKFIQTAVQEKVLLKEELVLLLSKVTAESVDNFNVLHSALRNGNLAVIKETFELINKNLLVADQGKMLLATTKSKWNIMHQAAYSKNLAIFEFCVWQVQQVFGNNSSQILQELAISRNNHGFMPQALFSNVVDDNVIMQVNIINTILAQYNRTLAMYPGYMPLFEKNIIVSRADSVNTEFNLKAEEFVPNLKQTIKQL